MNRKYLISFIAGLSFVALVGATFKSLMLDESGNCSQSVNFTGTTTLNSAAIATQAYSDGLVSSHNSDGSAHSTQFGAKAASGANSDITSISGLTTALSVAQGGTGATTANGAKSNIGLGNVANILNKLDATAAPTAGDDSADGYTIGSRWLDVSGSKEYVCSDATEGAAVWIDVTAGGTGGYDGNIATLDIDGGTDIGADVTDSDLIIVDDGAGGTNRKSEISRLWTYVASKITGTGVGTALFDTVTEKTSDNGVSIEGSKLKDSYIELSEISAPANPDSDKIKVYAKDSSGTTKVYLKDSAGTETELGSGTDSNAIHKATAAEINGLTEKTTPADDDEIVIEDSEASYAKKKVKISNLPSGSGGGLSWNKITSSTTASSGNGYLIDPAAAVTLTLPATPSAGDQVGVKAIDLDYTITVARNGSNIEGAASDMSIDVVGAGGTFVYADAATGWTLVDAIPTSTASSSAGGLSAYGFVYRTSAKDIASTNTWYNIEMDSNGPLSNITHSTSTNTERITVSATGVYEISYNVTVHRDSSGHHNNTRVLVNGTTEVAGSFASQGINSSDSNELQNISKTVMVSLTANDYITVQITTNVSVTNEIYAWDDANTADPTTMTYSSVSIKKLN